MVPVTFHREIDLGVGSARDVRILLDRAEAALRSRHASIIERTADSIRFEGETFRSAISLWNVMRAVDHGRLQIINGDRMNLRYELSFFGMSVVYGVVVLAMLALALLSGNVYLGLFGCFFALVCAAGNYINTMWFDEIIKDAIFIA